MKYSNVIIFAIGAAVGSATTWYLVKKKYEAIAKEEIESVKAVFSQKKQEMNRDSDDLTEREKVQQEKPDIKEYAKKLSGSGYTNYSNTETRDDSKTDEMGEELLERPYVIAPEQFQEFADYSVISLTYYADGVLADENDEKIDDVDEMLGVDPADHFGEYEDDSVFVRCDRLKVEYEILRSLKTYSEVLQTKPYLIEDGSGV